MNPRDAEAWLRLSFAALPTARTRGLLRHFNNPQALLDAALEDPKSFVDEHEITQRALDKLQSAARKDVSRHLEAMETHGIRVVDEAEYPELLTQIGEDTPPFLFIRGAFSDVDEKCVAIVGTRRVSEYGRGLAHKFGVELSRAGWTTVSGLARGIDTAAHQGALDGGGRTIAATACGLDIVYPSDNRELMLQIENSGAVLSEWAPTTKPEPWHFPARNRIIAGLSRAVIVVEAAEKSGALITATYAEQWNREVCAVPGNVHKEQSRGPHELIKNGAHLVESIDDVLLWLDEGFTARQAEAEPALRQSRQAPPTPRQHNKEGEAPKAAVPRTDLSPGEQKVWLALEVEPRHVDDIAQSADLPPGAVNGALVLLEIKGLAKRWPGNLFVKVV